MSNFKRYYQNNNMVFITIVTYNRKPLLVDNINLLRNSLKNIKYNCKIIAGIVLPDHLHLLIQTEKAEDYPKIIASFKANFSKSLPKNLNQTLNQLNRREKGIWQRKYYDHIIRDEKDFNKHLDYIHYNSMKHLGIAPIAWEFSSFKKFVKKCFYEENWCNFDDKNNINSMNLE
jgi:putative transposase